MRCTTRQSLEKSWPGAPLARDGDASGGEDVSLPSLMPGRRTLHRPLRKGPAIRTGEIATGLGIAEGWSDRRNTKSPKGGSKSYLDQQSRQPLSCTSTGWLQKAHQRRVTGQPQEGPDPAVASLPRPRAGDKGVGG